MAPMQRTEVHSLESQVSLNELGCPGGEPCAAGTQGGHPMWDGRLLFFDHAPSFGASLLQPKLSMDGPDLRRLDQSRMRDRDRVQRTFQGLEPKAEKLVQDRKLRTEIVVLPDVGLQQSRMIGQ